MENEENPLTIREIKNEVSRLLDYPHQNSLVYRAGVILLSLMVVGDNIEDLAKFTGYSTRRNIITNVLERIHKNEIYKDGVLYCNWLEEEYGSLSLILDIMAAAGTLQKVKENV